MSDVIAYDVISKLLRHNDIIMIGSSGAVRQEEYLGLSENVTRNMTS
jgi:hypothetical protein